MENGLRIIWARPRLPPIMALLTILTYPDPRLHTIAKAVAAVDARIQQLAQDMLETMYQNEGVGLAATQVNVHERVLVLDVSQDRAQPMVMINPRVLRLSSEMVTSEGEGCLSVPTIRDNVPRHARIAVEALDEHGQLRHIDAHGLMAICIQHEMDHLLGKVFVQYLSPFKQNRIRSKLQKLQKARA